ncbi:MAG: DUF1295 domain-containing protein [Pseudomonadales bacterium]|nr:DUF1295 domain-containing protein [Pseudomonadales bacterium]
MQQSSLRSIISIFIVLFLASLLILAGSQEAATLGNVPIFALCVALAFIIQWLAFIPAFLWQTERFYDLTGSLTYLTTLGAALWAVEVITFRSLLLALLIAIWAVRLGSFLFLRVMQDRKDSRFDAIKKNGLRFFSVWTIQGLWVSFTAAAALVAMSSVKVVAFGWLGTIGVLLWLAGFAIEVVADHQKRAFKTNQKQQGNQSPEFITTGLWAHSRHPNYFGEILLWCGIALIALPVLSGWQYITLLSPCFVYLLLTRVSGIPLLEQAADKRWGDNAQYQQYKASTPVLVPQLTVK